MAHPSVVCACPLQVLHWFEHNQPVVDASGMSARDYAAESKALACSLLEEQCGTVALFLTEMAQVSTGPMTMLSLRTRHACRTQLSMCH